MRIIDADALLDGEQTIPYPDVPFDVLGKMVDWFVKMVDKQPTIDAVPVVHGEWISDRLVTTNGGTYGVRRCSRCEAYYQDIGYGWDYCPNCGARMDMDYREPPKEVQE